MQTAIDHVVPEGRWAFDDTVTECFEDMLRRSIPQYDVMRQSVFELANQYVQPQTQVVDLGCSRGDGLQLLIDKLGAHNRFVGVDVSQPMLEAARRRFDGMIACGVVDIRECDLRTAYPPVRASVTMSVLSLQFTPIEYRQRILRDVYTHTLPGGAFIMVEKILGSSAEIDKMMVSLYYALKTRHNYTQEQIERKRLSLEGVLVPVTARWNEDMLKSAGFNQVDTFWRWMNFAGWIAVKD